MGFELCEGHLDRVQIGRVWRQVEQFGSSRLNDVAHIFVFMGRQIVHHDDVAGFERGHETLFEIGTEDHPVHRLIDHEGRRDRIVAKTGHKGRDLPMAVRDFADQALSALTAASQPRHVGAGAGFIDEDQVRRIKQRLIGLPQHARRGYVRAILLAGVHGFF